jgi:hypothetical protein
MTAANGTTTLPSKEGTKPDWPNDIGVCLLTHT